MAIGLLVAWIPGVQTPIALALVFLLRVAFGFRASAVAAAVGTWLTNPFTAVPLYSLSFLVGRPLAGAGLAAVGAPSPAWLETAASLAAGGLVLGLPIAFVGYHLTARGVAAYRERREARRALRRVAS